jgi:hypothetical protein
LQSHPAFNLDAAIDTLGAQPQFPRASLLVVLLAVSFALLFVHIMLKRDTAADLTPDGLAVALCAALPILILAQDPWLISWRHNPMNLHLRLVVALGVPAAVLVPLAVCAWFPREQTSAWLLCGLALGFLLPAPHWEGHAGPPPDNGVLHDVMVESGSRVPANAVILTDLPRGNMVRALWGHPWRALDVADKEGARPQDYRLSVLSPAEAAALQSVASEPNLPTPIAIGGPWFLVPELTWRKYTKIVPMDNVELNSLRFSTDGA